MPDERFDSYIDNIPVNHVKTLIMNTYYLDEWNWVSDGGLSKLGSTNILRAGVVDSSIKITEDIPLTLAENAGLDPIDMITDLKAKHDKKEKHEHHPVHESPAVMTIPLILLAILSAAAGYVGLPELLAGHGNARLFQAFAERFVAKPVGHHHLGEEAEIIMTVVTTLLILISMGLAYYVYVSNDENKMRDRLKNKFHSLWEMSFNKFKIDELYETAIYKPLYRFGNILVDFVEAKIINGFIRAVAHGTVESGEFLDDNKPEKLEASILYIVIGLTILVTAIFNAFIFS